MSEIGIILGWMVVLGLPFGVLLVAVFWPERAPKDRTVEAIRQRIETEDDSR